VERLHFENTASLNVLVKNNPGAQPTAEKDADATETLVNMHEKNKIK